MRRSEANDGAPDRAARAAEQWRRERPDLDPASMELFGRLAELARRVGGDHLGPFLARHGLKGGEFDVLATLRRAGEPHALTPTRLYEATMVTSGAMTGRLDRLERAGLVERRPDPGDRRGTLVTLSPKGLALIDRILPHHVANQERMLQALDKKERSQLSALLAKLLDGLPAGEPPD